jgi:hypothetical protein
LVGADELQGVLGGHEADVHQRGLGALCRDHVVGQREAFTELLSIAEEFHAGQFLAGGQRAKTGVWERGGGAGGGWIGSGLFRGLGELSSWKEIFIIIRPRLSVENARADDRKGSQGMVLGRFRAPLGT